MDHPIPGGFDPLPHPLVLTGKRLIHDRVVEVPPPEMCSIDQRMSFVTSSVNRVVAQFGNQLRDALLKGALSAELCLVIAIRPEDLLRQVPRPNGPEDLDDPCGVQTL